MLVENTEARLHTIALRNGTPQNPHDAVSFRLLPGVNLVQDSQWAEAKKLGTIQAMLREEILNEIGGNGQGEKALVSLKPNEAKKVASRIYDRDALKLWAAIEKRAEVRAAIRKQIQEITPEAAKDADDGEFADAKPGAED